MLFDSPRLTQALTMPCLGDPRLFLPLAMCRLRSQLRSSADPGCGCLWVGVFCGIDSRDSRLANQDGALGGPKEGPNRAKEGPRKELRVARAPELMSGLQGARLGPIGHRASRPGSFDAAAAPKGPFPCPGSPLPSMRTLGTVHGCCPLQLKVCLAFESALEGGATILSSRFLETHTCRIGKLNALHQPTHTNPGTSSTPCYPDNTSERAMATD